MIIQKIKYVNLDGVDSVGSFNFNLSQQDFVRLSLRYQPSITEAYEKMVAEKDLEGAYDLLTDVIESAYGVREGDAFIKNRRSNGRDSRPDLANFKFTPAFEQLMIDLMADKDLLLNFFRNLTNVPMSDEDFEKMSKEIGETLDEVEEDKNQNGTKKTKKTKEKEVEFTEVQE